MPHKDNSNDMLSCFYPSFQYHHSYIQIEEEKWKYKKSHYWGQTIPVGIKILQKLIYVANSFYTILYSQLGVDDWGRQMWVKFTLFSFIMHIGSSLFLNWNICLFFHLWSLNLSSLKWGNRVKLILSET